MVFHFTIDWTFSTILCLFTSITYRLKKDFINNLLFSEPKRNSAQIIIQQIFKSLWITQNPESVE